MNSELTLDEVLAEPIVRLLMKRDGVDEQQLRALAEQIRSGQDAEPRDPWAGGASGHDLRSGYTDRR